MRRWLLMLAGGAAMLAGLNHSVHAQAQAIPASAFYAVTYFDVTPAAFDKANEMLHGFAAATRKEDGNIEFTLLDQIGRSGRLAMIEGWRDKDAYEAHGTAVKALADRLQSFLASTFEIRSFTPLAVAPLPADPKLGLAMYVLTHIDVFPAGKDDAAALIKGLVADSRKDKGELRFDALVQDGRPNHFELIEAWTDHLAREAHASLDQTSAFRAKLAPLEGALYDERLYEVVR